MKRERPGALPGTTQEISTGWGPVYVTVNRGTDGRPFEVFVTVGKSGGLFNAEAEALGKTISNALRSGADPRDVAEDLAGIRADRPEPDNGDMIHSIPDAIGVALLRAIEDREGQAVRGDAEPGVDPTGDSGPDGPL